MTKTELQKELLEKIKPGVKASDIKRQNIKPKKDEQSPSGFIKLDEGYSSDEEEKNPTSIPTPPPPPTNQLALQKQIELHKEIKKADEKKKEELNEKIKTLIKLAGEEKAEYKQNIKDLQAKIAEQDKTIEELKNQGKTTRESKQELFTCYHCHKSQALPLLVLELPEGKLCQSCWTILRKKTKESVKPIKPTITNFTCHNCKEEKKEQEYKVKIDSTLQEYSTCPTCLPLIKEYNEKEKDSERELEEWE